VLELICTALLTQTIVLAAIGIETRPRPKIWPAKTPGKN
jgi:hypothetical protein